MQANERCAETGTSARLDALRSQQRFWRSPRGSWKREELRGWENDLRTTMYFPNTWIRCRSEGDLLADKPWRWNSIQCVSWEPLPDGGVVSDTWTLSIPFSFEGFTANPNSDLLILADTSQVPGSISYRYLAIFPRMMSQGGLTILKGSGRFRCQADV